MKSLFFICILCFLFLHTHAQVEETTTEQKLENLTANNEDIETEDDSYVQMMQQFLKNPVNLNSADEAELKELQILTPLQIQDFLLYRTLAGKLIDIYELQGIPGWDLGTIQKLRPYINVSLQTDVLGTLRTRLKKGDHRVLLSGSQVLEKQNGYLRDSSSAANFYPGSPQKIMFRYTYAYKHLLQYGIVAEKDAGEQFLKGKQKLGFDFYSFHFFVRKVGVIKYLAIGDFTVNLGQGLIQWQSLAFKKSPDVINIKRTADILRPYHSAGEINFHRGIGISLGKKHWLITAFASYRNIDANLVADSTQIQQEYVSSLQTSGYHRTKSEADDKGIQRQLAFGGNITYGYKRLHLGINGIHYRFKWPLVKSNEPYNKYFPAGNSFGNYSFDYSYAFENIHFFGEAAFTSRFDKAFINGIIISASSLVDMAILYRNISRSYQSFYSSAFTESSYPVNEMGLYAGVTVRPGVSWQIDAYADLYQFPWLKYRVDAPSAGSDYMLQVTYKPGKQLEMYSRYRAGSKSINVNPGNLHLSPVLKQPVKSWRTQFSYRISPGITLRYRTEIVWFDKNGNSEEQGFLTFFDLLYKPPLRSLSGSIRLQYFESGGYNSRLYAYENDVLFSFSIPFFYDKGYRYYLNINYDINRNLQLWVKFAQTVYPDKNLIGGGLDEIKGSKKSEIKLQAMYKF